jgi:hypothetical protein
MITLALVVKSTFFQELETLKIFLTVRPNISKFITISQKFRFVTTQNISIIPRY